MSDTGRQSFTDKAGAAMKVSTIPPAVLIACLTLHFAADVLQPDSQKSLMEQVGDSIKGTYDSLASSVQPEVSLTTSITTVQTILTCVIGRVRSPTVKRPLTRLAATPTRTR